MLSIKVSTLLHYSHMTFTWQSCESHITVATVMTWVTQEPHKSHKTVSRQLHADTPMSHMTIMQQTLHHVTKHETDRWQKSGYYATFLSGEEDRGLWNISTAEHFVSSLHHWCMQVSLITSMSISLVETLCIVGRNIKLLLVLVRKELANCSAILMLHWPLKMAT